MNSDEMEIEMTIKEKTFLPPDREYRVYKAKLAEQAERYEEMVYIMREVGKMTGELNMEERNLLSVAYKNVIGSRRASWRILNSIEQKAEQKDPSRLPLIKANKEQIEKELKYIITDIIHLLDMFLLIAANGGEAKVFFLKMKGDYNRYLSEFTADNERKAAANNSLTAYKEATAIAESDLQPTHPIRLGLALNFSVFYYEILNSTDHACQFAKKAFDDAITELDNLNEESYKDSTLIMQLLRDNLTLWTSDADQDDRAGDEDNN